MCADLHDVQMHMVLRLLNTWGQAGSCCLLVSVQTCIPAKTFWNWRVWVPEPVSHRFYSPCTAHLYMHLQDDPSAMCVPQSLTSSPVVSFAA